MQTKKTAKIPPGETQTEYTMTVFPKVPDYTRLRRRISASVTVAMKELEKLNGDEFSVKTLTPEEQGSLETLCDQIRDLSQVDAFLEVLMAKPEEPEEETCSNCGHSVHEGDCVETM